MTSGNPAFGTTQTNSSSREKTLGNYYCLHSLPDLWVSWKIDYYEKWEAGLAEPLISFGKTPLMVLMLPPMSTGPICLIFRCHNVSYGTFVTLPVKTGITMLVMLPVWIVPPIY